jgi:hypothetical protein
MVEQLLLFRPQITKRNAIYDIVRENTEFSLANQDLRQNCVETDRIAALLHQLGESAPQFCHHKMQRKIACT